MADTERKSIRKLSREDRALNTNAEMLCLIAENPYITNTQLRDALGITGKRLWSGMNKLQKEGFLTVEGRRPRKFQVERGRVMGGVETGKLISAWREGQRILRREAKASNS
jgi:predicted HTH transcriptional regulator